MSGCLVTDGPPVGASNSEMHTCSLASARRGVVATKPLPELKDQMCISLLELKDAGGFTPLLVAAWCGHIDLVKLLLSRGASTEPKGGPPMTSACGGVGPYDAETWAARKGFGDVVLAICAAKKFKP